MESEHIPINTFDSLLRDLLYWGLVAKVGETPGHRWQLAERVGLRLDELDEFTTASSSVPVERMVFFGHRCSECGFRQMTRVHDSRYVCDACWTKSVRPERVETTVTTPTRFREHHWIASRRQQTA